MLLNRAKGVLPMAYLQGQPPPYSSFPCPPSLDCLPISVCYNSSSPIMNMKMEESTVTEDSDDQSSVKSDDQSSLKSDDSSGSNRVKFLYSYGGRILPRPGDAKLRYAGGDTRVMAANRNITFADLMAKITEALGSSPVLKCQLPTEDLDALISIKSDEDLENVLEEYDRLRATQGSSKVRAFLFLKPRPLPAAAGHMDSATRSPPSEAHRAPQISQEPHGLEKYSCLPPNPNSNSTHVQRPAGRPPRSPAARPDTQPRSPVRYATPFHGRVTMPPQQNFAGRAYVDDGQFQRVRQSSCKKNYQQAFLPRPAQVPFSGMATNFSQHRRKTSTYENTLHNPYRGSAFHVNH